VFAQYGAQADAEIDRIIAQNMVTTRDASRPLAKRDAGDKPGDKRATAQRAG
jgi:membrane fusion protein (multidrug efflux system)